MLEDRYLKPRRCQFERGRKPDNAAPRDRHSGMIHTSILWRRRQHPRTAPSTRMQFHPIKPFLSRIFLLTRLLEKFDRKAGDAV